MVYEWFMSVKLNRPCKPEESQKNSNFNGKTILYPGFETGTSGLAVGSHNHCTIWVGEKSNSTFNTLFRGFLEHKFAISNNKNHKKESFPGV
jgi:hypothetical protein